jgi:Cys-tRNA(Pro)/Cys-tRNA(Cys) deacylase
VKTAQKTNAARLLDQMGIVYELREYEVDPEDLAAGTVAAKIGMPPEQVFKTLVARGDRNGVVMAVIPGDQELNLKALATAAGERKIQLVPVKECRRLPDTFAGESPRSARSATFLCSSTRQLACLMWSQFRRECGERKF